MMCMAAGFDIVLIFIGLELMAISTYVLVGFLRRNRRSNEAALKYLTVGRILVRHLCLRSCRCSTVFPEAPTSGDIAHGLRCDACPGSHKDPSPSSPC
jgi:hypothetical protein